MSIFQWLIIFALVNIATPGAYGQSKSEILASVKAKKTELQSPESLVRQTPLISGTASLSCAYDYKNRNAREIELIDKETIRAIIRNCAETGDGMAHLYYTGKIDNDLTLLIITLDSVLHEEKIYTRIFEINSLGGDIDAAMSAGTEISHGNWAVWIKRDARCFSACVLVLAAGSHRSISGPVGIHRMLNPKSQARTPTELQESLNPT
jgi:hypothetical protein